MKCHSGPVDDEEKMYLQVEEAMGCRQSVVGFLALDALDFDEFVVPTV